ncbi:type 2 lanthipeptide synthetase LanM family protein [Sorangium sp. So ce385]|uniref:type 2 lanthipeptide synthetase LanM family protein n=1 Tax=Sorangium sp. So ce385 TaxID=3133308 RepID=UPI003F5C0F60
MPSAPIPTDPWPRAAFFSETIPGGGDPPAEDRDAPAARARCERWRERCCLDEERFLRRLSAEGFDASSFGRLLAVREALREDAGPAAQPGEGAPGWQALLDDVLRGWDRLCEEDRDLAREPAAPFAPALHPFIAHGLGRIERSLPPIPGLDLRERSLRRALFQELARRLDRACRRVLVLELNVARLEERLDGETAEARFQHYCSLLGRRAEWEKLLSEYQVMARAIATITAQYIAAVTELFTRLAADFRAIQAALLPDARPARLIDARGGVSDPHRGGRSVWILELALGEDERRARLVYKPRSLAVDACFQGLLRWVSDRSTLPPFRTLRMLEREGYGWVEFVEHEACGSTEDAARFYVRQGALLALLHVLRAVDIHQENVIASGEHPVIVDLETLLHRENEVKEEDTARSSAVRRLAASVVRVGLLPQMLFGDEGDAGVNLGGLSDAGPQQTPFPVPSWDGVATDEMRQIRKVATIAPAQSLPRVGGEAIPATAHLAELTAGFEAMYRLLWARREELLSPEGPLAPFAAVETRHLLRPTLSYARILGDAAHPDHQRDAVDIEALLDVLWLMDREAARLDRAIGAEKEDLRGGDIPRFTARPGSCDLWDGRGRRIPAYFATDAMAEVRRVIEAFSSEELAWQTWLIRASIETLRPARGARDAAVAAACERDEGSRSGADERRGRLAEALVAEARRIGERLLETAIVGPRDVTWLGVGGESTRRTLAPVGSDLYDGTAGIALFLGYLGHFTQEARFSTLARRTAEGIARAMEREGARFPARLGGFEGEASQLYALACLSRLLRDPGLLEGALDHLHGFSRLWPGDRRHDIVGGAAGTLLALLAVHEASRRPEALDAAVAGAEALCDRAGGDILSLGSPGEPPLLGFSHGAAGIAYALFALLGALRAHGHDAPVQRIRALADRALSYERGHFDPEQRNWPAFRAARASSFKVAWCHGAPGVALGRTLALPLLDDAEVRREIEVAVETTLSRGMGESHVLCHGDLGNLMVVARAADALDRADWTAEVARHTARILAEIQRGGTILGRGLKDAVPNLLTGLAGVGYGLLYQAHPEAVPLVLGLAGAASPG